jgi:hypothetical protein
VVGIPSLGSADTIAPAVTKGNESLLNWLNEEIKALGEEAFSIRTMRRRFFQPMAKTMKTRWSWKAA